MVLYWVFFLRNIYRHSNNHKIKFVLISSFDNSSRQKAGNFSCLTLTTYGSIKIFVNVIVYILSVITNRSTLMLWKLITTKRLTAVNDIECRWYIDTTAWLQFSNRTSMYIIAWLYTCRQLIHKLIQNGKRNQYQMTRGESSPFPLIIVHSVSHYSKQ